MSLIWKLQSLENDTSRNSSGLNNVQSSINDDSLTLIDVRVVEYDDKRSQNERLIEINRNAAAAAGTTEKYSEGKLEELVEGARLMQKVARLLQVREFQEQMGIADLKEFTDDAEKAYPSSIKTEHPDVYYGQKTPAKINDRTRDSKKKKGFGK